MPKTARELVTRRTWCPDSRLWWRWQRDRDARAHGRV